MARTGRLAIVAALGLAAGAIGCAHCDTCDDFPAPCVGGTCGGPPVMAAPPPMAMGPTILEAAPLTSTPAAPAPAGRGPFSAPAAPAPAPSDTPPTPPAATPNG